MCEKQKLTPKIRFKGYADAWGQRKLGEVFQDIGTGKSKFTNNEKTNVFRYEILGSTSIIGYDVAFDYEGEFILTARVGANAGTMYRYKGQVKITDNTVFFKGENLDFMQALLMKFDLTKISFGTGQPLIKSSELKQLEVTITTDYTEQIAIGNFFRTLDTAITLHQRKLDYLRELKLGYLQQMFPQAGERVPRVRFDGNTENWEIRKLGDVIEKTKSYSLSRDVETTELTGFRYIHYGDIHKQVADIITSDEQLPHIKAGEYKPLKRGDLVLADASEDYTGIAEPSVITHEPFESIIAGLHTIALRPHNSDPLFLYYLLHTNVFQEFCGQVGTGLKVFGITFTNLSLFETAMPSLAEQKAIGSFFITMDNQITALSAKIERLKEMKAAYLQKMFI